MELTFEQKLMIINAECKENKQLKINVLLQLLAKELQELKFKEKSHAWL